MRLSNRGRVKRMLTNEEMVANTYKRRARSRHSNRIRRTGTRDEVFRLSNGKCFWCACHLPEKGWHLDHLIPYSKNGTDELSNLRATCEFCNLSRGTRSAEEFAEIMSRDLL